MKILVVTSEVTFVPGNYNLFLEGLFNELSSETELSLELVILKNNSPALTAKGLALALMGARHIGFHLMKNTLKAAFKDRKELTEKFKIKTHYFENPNTPEFRDFIKAHETDLLINARTRFIYKGKTLKLPKIAAINIHHGLLPDYRGTMCDLWALKADRPTGFTIHVMDKKIDNGAIIKRVQTSIVGNPLRSNFATLIKESSRIEGIEMAKVILTIKKNHNLPIETDNISLNPVYTKNPKFLDIRKLLQKGIEL
jgi:methionyl-tRNA formyltransferase